MGQARKGSIEGENRLPDGAGEKEGGAQSLQWGYGGERAPPAPGPWWRHRMCPSIRGHIFIPVHAPERKDGSLIIECWQISKKQFGYNFFVL